MPGGPQEERAWRLAAVALAGGASVAEAAEQVGVSVRTLRRWRLKATFVSYESQMRDEVVSQALGRLAKHLTKAADRIASLIGSTNPSVALKAAIATFNTVAPFARLNKEVAEAVKGFEKLVKEYQQEQDELDARMGPPAAPTPSAPAGGS
jgi:hypothetical protein